MLALQYAHRLPTDYPMTTIRERIVARGPRWDATPGLLFKAFAIRERGDAGATGNVYASIYLWRDAAAALDMLTDDDRFGAVIGAFGRPNVETLLPLAARTKGDGASVRWLAREDIALGADIDPRRLREAERAYISEATAQRDVLGVVSALDPSDWRLVRFTLAQAPVEVPRDATPFEVAYLARPGWAHLQTERT